MSTTVPVTPTPATPRQAPDLGKKRSGRTVRNGMATVLMGVCLVLVTVPLVFVLITVVQKGWSAVTETGWFTDDIPPVRRSGPGMAPAIVGTLAAVRFRDQRLTRPLAIIHRGGAALGLTASRFLKLLTGPDEPATVPGKERVAVGD